MKYIDASGKWEAVSKFYALRASGKVPPKVGLALAKNDEGSECYVVSEHHNANWLVPPLA